MKRLFFTLLTLTFTLLASAQTDFRHLSYEEALAAAKAEGKPVFIDFYTSWCGPCKAMAKNIFPLKEVGDYMNSAFVCIKLDAEKEGKQAADLFKIEAYPTMVIVAADGTEIYRKVGGTSDGNAFVTELKAGSNPALTPEKMRQRYEAGERTADLVSAYANYLYRTARESRRPDSSLMAKAKDIVSDYYANLTDSQRLDPSNLFVYSYSFCSDPKLPSAQFLFDNKDKFPASVKDQVDGAIATLLRYRMGELMQGETPYTQADVDIVAAAIEKTGLNAKGEYSPTIRTLTAMLQGDEAYFAQVKKDYDKMNISDQSNVACFIGNIIKTTDPAFCAKVAKWLRSKLPTMHYSTLYYVGTSIRSLEKRANPTAEEE